MTVDRTRISEKFLSAESYLEVLEAIKAKSTADSFQSDFSKQLKTEKAFEVVLQIMINVCTHIVSIFNETLDSYSSCFLILARKNVIPLQLGEQLALAAKMRNIIVHQYVGINYQLLLEASIQLISDFSLSLRHQYWNGLKRSFKIFLASKQKTPLL
ncbi:MAG: DUF86 domain-containing protein [Candidatus Hodarchaeota archaeon]